MVMWPTQCILFRWSIISICSITYAVHYNHLIKVGPVFTLSLFSIVTKEYFVGKYFETPETFCSSKFLQLINIEPCFPILFSRLQSSNCFWWSLRSPGKLASTFSCHQCSLNNSLLCGTRCYRQILYFPSQPCNQPFLQGALIIL